MNVVIYARFSSHAQNEQSIEGQLKICYDFANQKGYKVIGEYYVILSTTPVIVSIISPH